MQKQSSDKNNHHYTWDEIRKGKNQHYIPKRIHEIENDIKSINQQTFTMTILHILLIIFCISFCTLRILALSTNDFSSYILILGVMIITEIIDKIAYSKIKKQNEKIMDEKTRELCMLMDIQIRQQQNVSEDN